MTLQLNWKLWALNTAGGLIDGVQSFNYAAGETENQVGADGSVDPTFVAAMQQLGTLDFDTVKLKAALDIIGIDGYTVAAAADTYWQKMPAGGVRGGASQHIKVTTALGMIIPVGMSASQNGDATVSYQLLPRSSDGLTAPVVATASQSLAGSPTVDELFTLGPVKFGASFIDGITDVAVTFGINVARDTFDGHVYPTIEALDTRAPNIEFTTADLNAVEVTVGRAGAAISGASPAKVWFRKKAAGGLNVVNATAEHIQLTANEGRLSVVSTDAQHEQYGTARLRITPTHDGSNDIIAVDTAAAIA